MVERDEISDTVKIWNETASGTGQVFSYLVIVQWNDKIEVLVKEKVEEIKRELFLWISSSFQLLNYVLTSRQKKKRIINMMIIKMLLSYCHRQKQKTNWLLTELIYNLSYKIHVKILLRYFGIFRNILYHNFSDLL